MIDKELYMYKQLLRLHALILDGDLTEAADMCDYIMAQVKNGMEDSDAAR